ncbi:MAG: serine protease, trypsin family protein [Alphaproteobacteria bacterium]|nr:serine protease, trypsin family protein [Alphaproteobacteria bacterium]
MSCRPGKRAQPLQARFRGEIVRMDPARPIVAAAAAGLLALCGAAASQAQVQPAPPSTSSAQASPGPLLGLRPPGMSPQQYGEITQHQCDDATKAFEQDPSPANKANLCHGVSAGAVGGIVLTLPGYRIAAPWQAEIYSTYDYTDAELADDARKAASDLGKYYLDRKQPWERAHRCGGVYLGDGWVLTAAHCVTTAATGPEFLTMRKVRLGVWDLSDAQPGFTIVAAVIHKDYEKNPSRNDIALLKVDLHSGLMEEDFPQARLIGDPRHRRPLAVGARVGVTGWGATGAKADGPMMRSLTGGVERASAKLKEVRLFVVSRKICAAVRPYRGTISDDVICAGSPIAGQDACTWDSGGPLVRLSDRALVGIVSRGYGCGLKGVPGIYTRISSYRGWIERAKHAPLGQVSRM